MFTQKELVITSQSQAERLIIDGVIRFNGTIKTTCELELNSDICCASLICKASVQLLKGNLSCRRIEADNLITAREINAERVKAKYVICDIINCDTISALSIETKFLSSTMDVFCYEINAKRLFANNVTTKNMVLENSQILGKLEMIEPNRILKLS